MTATLGDAGSHDDASYTGETGDSVISVQYARNKVTEFQQTLQALDQGYQAALAALAVPGLDDSTRADLQSLVDEFEGKRWILRTTGEAINLGAAAFNAAGGRLPVLSIPQTLGFLPALSIPMIAAVGTAAALIAWGRTWLQGLNDRLKLAQQLDAQTTPEAKAALAQATALADSAAATANGTGLAALMPLLKWGAIGLGGFLLFRALSSARRSNPRQLEYADDGDDEPEDD